VKIPNAERVFVDVRKLRDYCLDGNHPRGQHKARLLKSALGWTADHAEDVSHRLLEAVVGEDASFLGADDYGKAICARLSRTRHGWGSDYAELVDDSSGRRIPTVYLL